MSPRPVLQHLPPFPSRAVPQISVLLWGSDGRVPTAPQSCTTGSGPGQAVGARTSGVTPRRPSPPSRRELSSLSRTAGATEGPAGTEASAPPPPAPRQGTAPAGIGGRDRSWDRGQDRELERCWAHRPLSRRRGAPSAAGAVVLNGRGGGGRRGGRWAGGGGPRRPYNPTSRARSAAAIGWMWYLEMLSWLLPPMSLHTHRGGWCGREREAGLSPGGGGGGASPPRCLPAAVPEPLLLLGCCLRPQDPAEPGAGERGRLLAAAEMMAEGGGGPARRKALSLLEAARSRYESLQISDDVFGESGQDSSGNPFYSTSADSRSAASSQDEEDEEDAPGRPGVPSPRGRTARRRLPRPAAAPAERRQRQRQGHGQGQGCGGPGPAEEEEEEEAEKGGWTRSLRDVPPPHFKDGSGTRRAGPGGRGDAAGGARSAAPGGKTHRRARLCCPALLGLARQVPPARPLPGNGSGVRRVGRAGAGELGPGGEREGEHRPPVLSHRHPLPGPAARGSRGMERRCPGQGWVSGPRRGRAPGPAHGWGKALVRALRVTCPALCSRRAPRLGLGFPLAARFSLQPSLNSTPLAWLLARADAKRGVK